MAARPESPLARAKLAGVRFGRLVVQDIAYINPRKSVYWNCLCDCGAVHQASSNALRMGSVKSCGCLKRDLGGTWTIKHGGCGTDEYRIYMLMLERCRNQNSPAYSNYGGRGITVCDRWQGDQGFANFLSDMDKRPSKKHSVDRIDNDKGYSPENCRWATNSVQARNKRRLPSNKSGVTGVSWVARDKAWVAAATIDGVVHHLIWTKDFFEAACARKSFDLQNPIGA